MVKKIILNLFRSLGYSIVKYSPAVQNTTRRTRDLTLHKTATGDYYLPTDAKADVVANTIINNGIFEEEVINLARKYIRPGSTVLDLGANFGQMSILFAGMVGEGGKVYSFD